MSSYAKNATLKIFEKHLQQYAPEDPLYEVYTDNNGRQKRRKVRHIIPVPRYAIRWFHLPESSN